MNIKKLFKLYLKTLLIKIFTAAKIISNSIKKNKTIFWCGNGGSASDSMHLSAELIGRFKRNENLLSLFH